MSDSFICPNCRCRDFRVIEYDWHGDSCDLVHCTRCSTEYVASYDKIYRYYERVEE